MSDALTVAAFDFDHTLLKGDSMRAFFRFYLGDWKFFQGLAQLSPKVLGFLAGRNDRVETKEAILRYFLAGKSSDELFEAGEDFAEKVLPRLERKVAMKRLEWHQKGGHLCLLVTASMDIWTHAWAKKNGLALISTRSHFDEDGLFTGKIQGENNWGPGKEKNLKAFLDQKNVNQIYAYGDSSGDREMLAMADYPFYRTFSE